ncbi:hypothetical protein K4L44_08065 [Halosquirtibacter laminarini]|uniref:Uncharacterized protein n=1 Tax=Halosquirtibacter laminarini TaxID=3374600 RepID=A0AC61NQD7_9BACT|nr:hypothetical protein K4L44_08065 [Prolixibacteraceae bacterium]
MRKYFLLFFLFLSYMFYSHVIWASNDSLHVDRKVRFHKEFICRKKQCNKNQKIHFDTLQTYACEYNIEGCVLKAEHYNDDGSLFFKDVFSYREDGKLSGFKRYFFKNTLGNYSVMKYWKSGKISSRSFYNYLDELLNSSIFDENGNLLIQTSFMSGRVDLKTFYKYNSRGEKLDSYMFNGEPWRDNLIEKVDSMPSLSESIHHTRFEYDAHGNVLKKVFLHCHERLIRYFTYKYDDHHNLIEEVEMKSKVDTIGCKRCLYDENNNKVREVYQYFKNSKLNTQVDYIYDDFDRLICEKKQKNDKITEKRYFYDEYGKLNREDHLVNGEETKKVIYQNTYF